MRVIGRNDPCPCGSGKKYKKCCLQRDEALAAQHRPVRQSVQEEDHFIAELLPEVDKAVDRLLLQVEQGRLENVETDLKRLLSKHPNYHMTNYAMGVYLAVALKDPQSAIPFFQKAVKTFPIMAEAHFNLGACYLKTVRIVEAVDSLQQAIRYASDDDIADKAREELRTLEDIVKTHGSQPTLGAYVEGQKLFDRAFECLQKQDYQEAVDLYQQVLAQIPDHVQSHGNLGLACAGLGKKALALEHLDKALALDPDYQPAIHNRRSIETMKEGQANRPMEIAETNYYRDSFEPDNSEPGASGGWWNKLKRVGAP